MITSKDLKNKGITAIEEELKEFTAAHISINGIPKYVTITEERFEKLKLAELEMEHRLALEDIKNGDYTESEEVFFEQLEQDLKND